MLAHAQKLRKGVTGDVPISLMCMGLQMVTRCFVQGAMLHKQTRQSLDASWCSCLWKRRKIFYCWAGGEGGGGASARGNKTHHKAFWRVPTRQ